MADKKESYEDLVKRLENIIDDMENKDLTLNELMKSYEEGVNIYNKLYKILNEAEGKIKIIMEEKEENFAYDKE